MEKVKVTQEQVDALELAIEEYGNDRVMNGVTGKWHNELKPLNDIRPSDLARALYDVGYEAGPEFEIGELLYHKPSGVLGKLIKHDVERDIYYINVDSINTSAKHFRRATDEEKQRRWWASNNRGVYEVTKHDLLDINDVYLSVVEIYESDVIFSEGPSVTEQELVFLFNNGNAIVACFAEDRKDI